MSIRIYNTLSKQKEVFEPVVPGKVGIYLCGPTVYAEAHIGHMVGPVIFDTVKRYLTHSGYDVKLVVNITDVDDKIINKANERNLSMGEVAAENEKDYLDNLAAFGVDQIDEMPKATQNIGEIIKIIKTLEEKDFAYNVDGNVFFDVGKDPNYGKLSNRTADSQQGEGGGAAAQKRSPGDFALWKAAKPEEPSWDSPWGKGRPGWHIECSAMSRRVLGESFDIHGGGLDLVFPHHENEIAQSECCHGAPMAKYWMHNGLLRAAAKGKVGGKSDREDQAETPEDAASGKLSRSKGGGGLHKLVEKHGGESMRFFLLRTHYRSTVVFGDEGLADARSSLDTFHRLFERYQRVTGESFYELAPATNRTEGAFEPGDNELSQAAAKHRNAYFDKMDDDFNTAGAVSEMFELMRAANRYIDAHSLEEEASRSDAHLAALKTAAAAMREMASVLGIFRAAPAASGASDELAGQLMELLIDIRANARSNKDFATSDRIRDGLAALNITLEDRKDGTGWRLDS